MNRFLIIVFFVNFLQAQVGIGTTNPNANAMLDIVSEGADKGLVLPRVQLTGTSFAAPMTAHVQGMVVYNTAFVADVYAGYYYNDGTKWIRIANEASANNWSTTGNTATTAGTNYIGTTDSNDLVMKTNNTQVMRLSASGNVAVGTTTPNASALLDLNSTSKGFLPPRLTTTQRLAIIPTEGLLVFDTDLKCYNIYANGSWHCLSLDNTSAAASLSAIDCAGIYSSNTLYSGNTISNAMLVIPYSGGNGGYYAAASIASAGVTGITAKLYAGSLANGNGTLTYYLSGTPATTGTASFAIALGSVSCTVNLTVNAGSGMATLNCAAATLTGTITDGTALSGAYISIPYTGGNGGSYNAQVFPGTGNTSITGLLAAGSFATGSGTLTIQLYGTPNGSLGTTSNIPVAVGSSSCIVPVTIGVTAAVGSINCATATATNATVITGKVIPPGYTFSIPYTSGSGNYTATVTSSSHPGVTATASQALSASGGNIVFTLSGTPAADGAISFNLAVGPKSCTYSGITAATGVSFATATSSSSHTIPTGISKVTVKAWGAAGRSENGYYGGYGAYVKATVSVTPGESLTVKVGGGGTSLATALNGGGYNGGGGYSGVFRGATPLIVAGGGGGAANNDYPNAGNECSHVYGGSAGISNGYAGGRYVAGGVSYSGYDTTGGTQTAGGTGGDSSTGGSAYQGGTGYIAGSYYGGGGGGGYYGGGGGTNRSGSSSGDDGGGGGAGGSSYIIPGATNIATGEQAACVSTATVAAPGSSDADYDSTNTPARPVNMQPGKSGRIVILYEY